MKTANAIRRPLGTIVFICLCSIGAASATEKWDPGVFIKHGVTTIIQPNLGSSRTIINGESSSSYLFPGIFFSPPEMPLGFSIHELASEVEQGNDAFGPILNPVITALQLSPAPAKNSIILGRRNLKELFSPRDLRRPQAEDGVNFLYGVDARILGLDKSIDYLAGAIAIATYASRKNFLPYGGLNSIDRGDDPRGGVYSKMGQEYYNSGQYMKDYFFLLKERYGWASINEQIQFSTRRPAWQEAYSRLRSREGLTGTESRTVSETLKRQWESIEKAEQYQVTHNMTLSKLQDQEKARLALEQEAQKKQERDTQWQEFLNAIKERQEYARKDEEKRKEEERKSLEELKKKAEEERKKKEEDALINEEFRKKLEQEDKNRMLRLQQQRDQDYNSHTQSQQNKINSSGGGGVSNSGQSSFPLTKP